MLDKYLDLARGLKKFGNVMVIPIAVGAPGKKIPKNLEKTGWIGDQSKNEDHPDHSSVKIF